MTLNLVLAILDVFEKLPPDEKAKMVAVAEKMAADADELRGKKRSSRRKR